jgi:hypothetical protein
MHFHPRKKLHPGEHQLCYSMEILFTDISIKPTPGSPAESVPLGERKKLEYTVVEM